MQWVRHRIAVAGLLIVLAAAFSLGVPSQVEARQHASYETRSSFNDEYIFATTKSVNDMQVNPGLKLTLFPVTIVLDTVFLPFAVIAGFVA